MTKVNGAGTIAKMKGRNGKVYYRIRHNLGVDPITKKRLKSPWRGPYHTKAEATEALVEYRKELEGGIRLETDSLTFAEYVTLFCEQREQQGSLAPNSLRQDEKAKRILIPYLGDMKLREIDALTIQGLLSKLGKDGKTPSAVARAYRSLNQILKTAQNQDYITRNPCDKIKPPSIRRPEINYLDSANIAHLITSLEKEGERAKTLETTKRATKPRKEHNYEDGKARAMTLRSHIMATRLLLATGVRRGEGLGLTWKYLDLEDASLRISQQITMDGLRPPKTKQGMRTISLDSDTVKRLGDLKANQAEYLLGLGIKQDANTPVFINEIGGFIDPNNFSRWWRGFCKEYGFEGLRIHDLRHTQATQLIAQNVDIKTVQSRLGHATAAITLDLYAGVMPSKDREAAEVIGNIISAATEKYGKIVNI